MTLTKIRINCGCGSYIIFVRSDRPKRWLYGPRCCNCGKILGPMEWSVVSEKTKEVGDNDA